MWSELVSALYHPLEVSILRVGGPLSSSLDDHRGLVCHECIIIAICHFLFSNAFCWLDY